MQVHINRSVLCAEHSLARWLARRTLELPHLAPCHSRDRPSLFPCHHFFFNKKVHRGESVGARSSVCEEEPLSGVLPSQRDLLLCYLDAVLVFNRHTNLTAVRDRDEAVQKHINDSLALLPAMDAQAVELKVEHLRVIDVGSGAGFPGVIIAIARPLWQVTVLDSLKKRCDFVSGTLHDLGIRNVDVLWGRAETAGQDPEHREKFDVAIARAVAEMRVLSEYCLPFVRVGGALIAAKGPSPQREVNGAQIAISLLGGKLLSIEAVQSYSDGETQPRTAVTVRKVAITPPQYPRREGKPLKRPL